MEVFAELLNRLAYTPGRNAKLALMANYFRTVPDPDRGWALAALTDGLAFSFPLRNTLRTIMADKVDATLLRLSRDYVGDTAETVALLWPQTSGRAGAPGTLKLRDVVDNLQLADRHRFAELLISWLDRLDANGRWALLKLLTGALRVGVSARLAKLALANAWQRDVAEIEELWHALSPPYGDLFGWLEGRAPRPDTAGRPVFRPLMLATPLLESDLQGLDLTDFAVEWKWDGIRVQVVANNAGVRIYSRTGDDISASFPDLIAAFSFDAVLDGELLVVRDGTVAPFSDLQQRLNRKSVSKRQMQAYPAHIRLYDALEFDGLDVRDLTYAERRMQLLAWHARTRPDRTDISHELAITSKSALMALWQSSRDSAIEGLMLKRRTSPYLPGRPKGHWFKWKRAPLTVDCVLMYAQRGSGKRSSYYSDFTFGTWRHAQDGRPELVPVGKAYSGFSNDELLALDRWVRSNTTDRFGPVRAVRPLLVLEVAFDSVHCSQRHKSGVAMRFPRISRIRWDKPAQDADDLATVLDLIGR